jgi:replicative DNA helicase
MILLAARPGMGKTALALNIAQNASVLFKKRVAFFSLEMSKEELVDRLLVGQADIDAWRLKTGRLGEDDFAKLSHAMGVLAEASLYIDDTPGLSIAEIRTKARRLQMEHGLGLIVIDYLQLMESRGNSESRVQEISEITRGLKGIARELNVPVLALSQLSRTVELSKPAIPKLSHLRESGSIEQDADVVLFIYRKSADRNYRPEDIPPDEKNSAEIHIAKHRNGPTGVAKMIFDEQRASFRSITTRYAAESSAPAPQALKPKSAFSGGAGLANPPM